MKKKISKKFLILLISASASLITGIAFACAGGDEFMDFYNSFFAPETSKTDVDAPFYRSFQTFYGGDYFEDTTSDMDSTNLHEWKSFFNNKVRENDLDYMVYQSRIGEIDSCLFFLKNAAYPVKPYLKKNTIFQAEDKTTLKEFLFYLGYAKRCEPYCTYVPDYWNENDEGDPRSDNKEMLKLVNGGKKAMTGVKSAFIKEKYAFQVIRMLFQMGYYEDCIAFYNQQKGIFSPDHSAAFRTMGYVAGSCYKLKQYSQANYLYAQVFLNCPDMKKSSFLSFHPQEEADWQEALAMAQNNREKMALWQLLGIYADPLRAMKEINKLQPGSDMMDLLLVRAVNINEENFIPNQDYWAPADSGFAFKNKGVDQELLAFAQNIATTGSSAKPYLWNMVTGYLYLGAGNYKLSEKFLAKAAETSKGDQLVEEQIRAFRIINKIEEYKKVNTRVEEELARELNWLGKADHPAALRGQFIYQWALSRLSEKYTTWGDSVKSLCLDYQHHPKFYEHSENMSQMIAFMDKANKSNFEKFILTVYPYNKATLFDYKAIGLIYQYKFREALATMDSCKGAGEEALPADPFVIHINDCHDCDFLAERKETYTRYTFTKRLLELQTQAGSDPKKASANYFLLANGLYNMTYFGNVHMVFDSPLIDLSVGYFDFSYNEIKPGSIFFDCRQAMEYYQRALEASTDKEFKAQCCFMAAKCEQNIYYCSTEYNYDSPIRSGNYFRELVKSYPKTKYYKEIINECGYFRTFVSSR